MFSFLKKKSNSNQEIIFDVKGMHCTSCSLNIDGELEEMDGVSEAETSYTKATTKVKFDPDQVTEDELRKVIERLGYEAK